MGASKAYHDGRLRDVALLVPMCRDETNEGKGGLSHGVIAKRTIVHAARACCIHATLFVGVRQYRDNPPPLQNALLLSLTLVMWERVDASLLAP